MIPRAIRAAFRWWTKHPWTVFWGTILIVFLLFLLYQPSEFVSRTILLLLAIVLILSFILGMFLRWQLSKIEVIVTVGFIAVFANIFIESLAYLWRWSYDSDVKANLKNAANAEEAYYKVNGTYTANIGNLKGFNQRDNVTIAVEATPTIFVITGTMTKRCGANTGVWLIDSTTGAIDGTPCRLTMYGFTSFIRERDYP